MKLILIRHGIAQERNPQLPDEARELMARGRRQIETAAVQLAIYLGNQSVRLISSPILRARESAEIFSRAGLGELEIGEFVGQGDYSALIALLSGSTDPVTVIVGHSPDLEEWAYELTQTSLSLDKGAAVEIEVNGTDHCSGRINWQVKVDQYNRLLDFPSIRRRRDQFSAEIDTVVADYIAEILRFREIYLREPQEVESVHKLRVKIRQFRSLTAFFKPLMKKRQQREIQNVLRAMAQECAYLREVDVLIQEWVTVIPQMQDLPTGGEAFLRVLRGERDLEQARLCGVLEKPDFARTLKEIEGQIISAIDLQKTRFADLADMVQATLEQWHHEIQLSYEAIDSNDLAIIHALRIRAKKQRYLLEIFGYDQAEASKARYKEIRSWQEVLGDLTDANRNSEAVREIAQCYPDEPIDEEIVRFIQIQGQRSEGIYQEFFGARMKSTPAEKVIPSDGEGSA